MNEKSGNESQRDRDDVTMARLLRLAGEREPIPDDVEERVYSQVQREWQTSTHAPESGRVYRFVRREWKRDGARGNRARRWVLPLAVAASVLLAVAVVTQPPPPADISIATVAKVTGDARIGVVPAPGEPVYPGDILSTSDGQGISLVLSNAESLRLDQNTTLVAEAGDRFVLARGRVYADTGDFMYRPRSLVIDTTLGVVTDVGTQFAVAVGDDHLDVAVREGRVDVTRSADEFRAVAGERMRVRRDGAASIDELSPYDPYWDWIAALAPTFDIENKSLLDFLRWAARETGRELVFESDEVRMAAMRVDLHGSVADFEPLDALESILASTRFRYRIEPDWIIIEK